VAGVGATIGGYRIVDRLGEGGMAVVYRAEHLLLGKQVAIKQPRPEWALHPKVRRQFLQEARIASGLYHECILAVHDFGNDDGQLFLVTDLVRGPSVADQIERGAWSYSQALAVGVRITDAISAVHAAGALHLDIKTDNVLLERHLNPRPVLIDFGVARMGGSGDRWPFEDLTDALPVGTPRCMAPEQASAEAVDQRTDIWGLGVLMYEMLEHGRPPFGGDTLRETLVEVVTADPRPMSPALPASLRDLVQRCLSKDPSERPSSAAEVRDAIARAAREYRAESWAIDSAIP